MKYKKFMLGVLGITLLTGIVTGCASSNTTDTTTTQSKETQVTNTAAEPSNDSIYTEPGTFPIVKEKIQLTIFAPQDGENSRDENAFTKEIEEMTNIDIVWRTAPSGSLKEKMNLMLASGDLSDIILTGPSGTDRLDKTMEALLGSQGLIIPLNDLLDNKSVGYKQAFEELDGLRDYITTPDGNIYSLPNVDGSLHIQYNNKLWLNTVWLDRLGLEMPTTTDELYTVLKAFKEQDANGNGDPNDEIPLSTCKSGSGVEIDGYLMNPFILTPQKNKMWIDENKQVVFSPIEEEYKEGLNYLNKLYSEGLINPESFTQDMKTQVNVNENGKQPVIGAFLAQRPGYANDLNSIPNSKKWEQYQSVPPLAGPSGEIITDWNPYAMYQTGMASITSACKYPEAALRLIDYIATPEGTLRNASGIEGVHWREATEGELDMEGKQAKITSIPGTDTANVNWGQLCGLVRTPEMVVSYTTNQDPYAEGVIPLVGRQIVMYRASLAHQKVQQPFESVLPELYYSETEAEEIALLKTTIMDYVNESVVRFVTGALKADKDWDSYVNQLKALDLDRYLELVQEGYNNSAFIK